MPMFEVLRSYQSVEVYHVEAENEAAAYRKTLTGEGHYRTYDGDYDDEVHIVNLGEQQ